MKLTLINQCFVKVGLSFNHGRLSFNHGRLSFNHGRKED